MDKKMYVEVWQDGKISNEWSNQQDIVMQLLSYFFRLKKSKNNNFNVKITDREEESIITVKTWFYNCDNKQVITTLKFYNIPLHYGWIDTYKINKLVIDEIKAEN